MVRRKKDCMNTYMSWVREYGLWLAGWRFASDNQGYASRGIMKSNAVFSTRPDADHFGCSDRGHLQDIFLDNINVCCRAYNLVCIQVLLLANVCENECTGDTPTERTFINHPIGGRYQCPGEWSGGMMFMTVRPTRSHSLPTREANIVNILLPILPVDKDNSWIINVHQRRIHWRETFNPQAIFSGHREALCIAARHSLVAEWLRFYRTTS